MIMISLDFGPLLKIVYFNTPSYFAYSMVHSRIILRKILVSTPSEMRLKATKFLETLASKHQDFHLWGIGLYANQLYDPDVRINQIASEALLRLCSKSSSTLEALAKLRPDAIHVSQINNALMMILVGSEFGFNYLHESGFVENEMDFWIEKGIVEFVKEVEFFISYRLYSLNIPSIALGSKEE